ncbi:hypothetical protein ACPTHZ_15025, partial [Enterococcus faecium]|uniref:hypothetical protein n=1 Tax=Enterococcus faecium TaxID=1352 RepID=UPI003CC54523
MFNRYLNGLQIRDFYLCDVYRHLFGCYYFCYNRLLICFHDYYRRHDDYGCSVTYTNLRAHDTSEEIWV